MVLFELDSNCKFGGTEVVHSKPTRKYSRGRVFSRESWQTSQIQQKYNFRTGEVLFHITYVRASCVAHFSKKCKIIQNEAVKMISSRGYDAPCAWYTTWVYWDILSSKHRRKIDKRNVGILLAYFELYEVFMYQNVLMLPYCMLLMHYKSIT